MQSTRAACNGADTTNNKTTVGQLVSKSKHVTQTEAKESITLQHLEQAISRFKFLENKALSVELTAAELDEILRIAHLVERTGRDLGLSTVDLAGIVASDDEQTTH